MTQPLVPPYYELILKEAIRCPMADCGNRALRAITSTVNLLAAGGAPLEVASLPTSSSWLGKRKVVQALDSLLLGMCFDG